MARLLSIFGCVSVHKTTYLATQATLYVLVIATYSSPGHPFSGRDSNASRKDLGQQNRHKIRADPMTEELENMFKVHF